MVGIRHIIWKLREEVWSWDSKVLEMLVKGMGIDEIAQEQNKE